MHCSLHFFPNNLDGTGAEKEDGRRERNGNENGRSRCMLGETQ
jgi:hypothetical protein